MSIYAPFSPTTKDPLVDEVKKVMKENAVRRSVTETYNKELGIQSEKNLPHEKKDQYHSELDKRITKALNEQVSPSRT